DLLCEILSAQDTQHDAVEFRARRRVEALERRLVALGDGGDQPDQLSRRQHSASPPHRDPLSLPAGKQDRRKRNRTRGWPFVLTQPAANDATKGLGATLWTSNAKSPDLWARALDR